LGSDVIFWVDAWEGRRRFVLLRILSPNLRLVAENIDSTLDRR
jgi:hypothetical protein